MHQLKKKKYYARPPPPPPIYTFPKGLWVNDLFLYPLQAAN